MRLWRAGRLRRAQQQVVRAIALFDGAAVVELVGALLTLADFEFQLARYADAEATLGRAIRLLDAAPRAEPCQATLVDALIRLANSQRRQGKLDVAEATLRGAIAGPAEHATPVEPLSAVNNALGVVYKDAGRYAEAAERYAAALATSTHTDLTACIYHNLAGLAHAEGRFADALTPARTALMLHRREHGPTATEVAADAAVLGAVLLGLGHLDEAETQLGQAYRIWVRRFGPDHYEVAVCLHSLGVARYRRGDPAAALRSLDEALRIKTSVLGPDHPEIAALQHNLAVVHAHPRPAR
ncbi:hypothetical protein Prum_072960 [Phytohabitans rumicis]|uniref:Uncharacterized protein n=1 Tax=Phytohabitans rumicis TaxID=1076125 RepID=A0A6V8LBB6_9ACTN|nr:hypothetical protein Prum_072960 [Phytohabitans rumicis]